MKKRGIEFMTLIGLALGVGAVLGAMHFKHVPLSAFNNRAALLVIFAGTVASVLNAFPGRDLKNIGKLFMGVFTSDKANPLGTIKQVVAIAETARREGVLAIEQKLDTIDNDFMKKGFQMVVDGSSEDYVEEVLESEISEMEERHSINASIFAQAGAYAPTLGVLGAVFGLIAAMESIDNTDKMAEAVAAAFMATILGIFTGYVLWNPFANKLKMKSKHEVQDMRIILEGIKAIQSGYSPNIIKEKLLGMLPKSERGKYDSAKE
jgi:chemotaxis protein MotA